METRDEDVKVSNNLQIDEALENRGVDNYRGIPTVKTPYPTNPKPMSL